MVFSATSSKKLPFFSSSVFLYCFSKNKQILGAMGLYKFMAHHKRIESILHAIVLKHKQHQQQQQQQQQQQ
jgi:hypothetical protein